MRLVVVRLPDGRVVDGAVGLRDLVVQRAVERRRARGCSGRVLVRVARVPLLPNSARTTKILSVFSRRSSTYWSSWPPWRLPHPSAGLRALGLAEVDDGAAVTLLDLLGAVQHLQGLCTQVTALVLEGVGQRIGTAPVPAAACCGADPLPVTAWAETAGLAARPTSTARLAAPTPVLRAVKRSGVPRSMGAAGASWAATAMECCAPVPRGADLSNHMSDVTGAHRVANCKGLRTAYLLHTVVTFVCSVRRRSADATGGSAHREEHKGHPARAALEVALGPGGVISRRRVEQQDLPGVDLGAGEVVDERSRATPSGTGRPGGLRRDLGQGLAGRTVAVPWTTGSAAPEPAATTIVSASTAAATTRVTARRPRRFRRRWAGRTSRPVGTSRNCGRADCPRELRSEATAALMESSISRTRDRPAVEHVSDRTCVRFLARHPTKVETRVEQVFETPAGSLPLPDDLQPRCDHDNGSPGGRRHTARQDAAVSETDDAHGSTQRHPPGRGPSKEREHG